MLAPFKVNSQKYWNPRKIQNEKFLIKWQNQNPKHIKRMDNNCHISENKMSLNLLEYNAIRSAKQCSLVYNK